MSTSAGAAKSPPPPTRRAIVYVDGYNLYYNAIEGTAFKWLNLEKMVRAIRNNDDVRRIYYFTALALGYKHQRRQTTYWKALQTLPIVTIVEGRHKEKDRLCLVRTCGFAGSKIFKSPEEKRTDVSIAVQMLDDAYRDECDLSIVVSGDSDLVPAIARIRQRFPEKEVTVYVPNRPGDSGHHEIRAAANKAKDLPLNVLKHSQFPDDVSDGNGGTIKKPREW